MQLWRPGGDADGPGGAGARGGAGGTARGGGGGSAAAPASGRAAAPADEGARPAAAAETEEDAPPGADGGVPHIPGAYLVEEDAAGQPRYIIQPSPDDVVVDVEAR